MMLSNRFGLLLRASSLQQQRVSNDVTQELATRVSATPASQPDCSKPALDGRLAHRYSPTKDPSGAIMKVCVTGAKSE
jgi:hypothetical protein